MSSAVLNAFTVDVEDYFQVSAFEPFYPRDRWDTIPLRLERGLGEILESAAAAGVRGSFYAMGWLARRRPDILRRVVAAGHEIGCHSMAHELIYRMGPERFREDLRVALDAIEDAVGEKCRLYRAPSFSITAASLWALELLAEAGIEIDSSIYPVRHDRYGLPGAPLQPFLPLPGRDDFVEFPPSAVRVLGATVPCAGGGYLRLAPRALTSMAIRRINRAGRPALVYVHPWELDPDQPRAPASWRTNLRHRIGLSATRRKVERLFASFDFGSMTKAVARFRQTSGLQVVPLGEEPAGPRPGATRVTDPGGSRRASP